MYSQRALTELAAHKAALRGRIARRRADCVLAAREMAEPLRWLDAAAARWRQVSPVLKAVALPLGILLGRAATKRTGLLGTLIRWGPLALGAIRAIRRPSARA
jgi:hypothetical protein